MSRIIRMLTGMGGRMAPARDVVDTVFTRAAG